MKNVAVIDIGKPGKSLGWYLDGPQIREGVDIDDCTRALAQALLDDGELALGFEAPLFVPRRDDPLKLLNARAGESGKGLVSRPFSAGAGPTVLVAGLTVVPYVLKRLRDAVPDAECTFDWRGGPSDRRRLLLFEAFVTNQKKHHDRRHIEDAELAVRAFRRGAAKIEAFESSINEPACLNLLGAMLLQSGWSSDISILSEPCLVVRV